METPVRGQSETNFPLAYLITIRTYGTWLHGDERNSVDRHNFNAYGSPRVLQSENLKNLMKLEMKQTPFYLDKDERICVLESIKEVCEFRGYKLLAINIRTNHLHAVVSAQIQPEKITNDFKSYATRNLRSKGFIDKDRIVWARGKSSKYLWRQRHVEIAVDYVLFGQGDEILDFN